MTAAAPLTSAPPPTPVWPAATDAATAPPLTFHRVAVAALAVGVAVTWAAALAVGSFAMPAWDDFMRAVRLGRSDADLGWARYVFGFTYRHWQGRWASCGIEAAVLPTVDPTRHYRWLIGAVALANAAGLYACCRAVTRRGPRRLAVAMTVVGLALVWAGLPQAGVAEAVYWFVGAVENTLPLALAGAILAVAATARPHPATAAGLCLAAVVCTGLHELYGAMLCVALTVATTAAFAAHSDRRWTWLATLVAAAVGLLVVALAPGNAERMRLEMSPLGHGPARVLTLTGRQLWQTARPWLFDAKLIAATLWVAFSPALAAARTPWPPSPGRLPWRWIVPLTWLSILAVGYAVPTWAQGAEMQPRTVAGNYVVFVAGWLLTVLLWAPALPPPPARHARSVTAAALLLLGGALVGVGNVFSAAEDLSHRLRPWHAAVDARYAQLRRARGSAAQIRPLPSVPYLLLGGDVTDDPTDYRNRGPTAFFGVRSLTLAHDPPPPHR